MKGQVKLEPPKSGEDSRGVAWFYEELAKRYNLPIHIKPDGVGSVTIGENEITFDFGGGAMRFNVASNGQPATVPLLALGPVRQIV